MFLRLRAVYLDQPHLVYTFLSLWLVTSAATCVTMIPAFHASHISMSRRCIVDSVHSLGGVGIILIAFTDTVFFLAISYRLLKMYQYGDTWRMRLKSFFGGSERHLSGVRRRGLSHALLRGGQQYYLYVIPHINIVHVLTHDQSDSRDEHRNRGPPFSHPPPPRLPDPPEHAICRLAERHDVQSAQAT